MSTVIVQSMTRSRYAANWLLYATGTNRCVLIDVQLQDDGDGQVLLLGTCCSPGTVELAVEGMNV